MPAAVERPDDVLHRPDWRDDDAHLLRKPGPPHLRRPRDPHPQTAWRRRRHQVSIQRRDAENAEEAQRKPRPYGEERDFLPPRVFVAPRPQVLTCICFSVLTSALSASLR